MVRKILFFIFCFTQLSFGALQYLVRTTEANTAFDTVTTNWNAGDDASRTVNLGFSFPFNTTTYTQVRINSNGVLNFNTSNTAYANTALPGPVAQSIYPYWDDLIRTGGGGATGTIRYGTIGTAGVDRRFAVTWTNVRHYNNGAKRYTFQVVLYEDGKIRFRYLDSSDADGTRAIPSDPGATVGVQETASNYDQYSYDAAFDKSLDVVYYPKPAIALTKSSCVLSDPANGTTNPKRIPGATIRYAIGVAAKGYGTASNIFVTDTIDSSVFDTDTIRYLQIQSGACNCSGVSSANNNGPGGSGDGENPVILDYESITVSGNIVRKCGYFEVDIK